MFLKKKWGGGMEVQEIMGGGGGRENFRFESD